MAGVQCVLLLLALTQAVCGDEYLLGLAKTFKATYINAVTGRQGGSVTYELRESDGNETVVVPPFSREHITVNIKSQAEFGVKDKALVVSTSDGVSLSVSYRYAAFSPLPIRGLGTQYMLPFCGVNQRKSFVVIAAYKEATSLNITLRLNAETFLYKPENKYYNDGEVLSQSLQPFQTYMFEVQHDVTGTVIDSSQPVAVFMGSIQGLDIDTYEQIPPIRSFGKEFVVAVDDQDYDTTLNVISAEYGNEITFNGGRTVRRRFYSETLDKNTYLQFKTTKPAMTTICRIQKYRQNSAFVIVPPVELYATIDLALYVPYSKVTSTVKVMTSVSTNVQVKSSGRNIATDWVNIPTSAFKVGTCQIMNDNATVFIGNDSFAVLAFSPGFVQNGGYVANEDTSRPKSVTGGMPQSEKVSQIGGLNSTVAVVGLVCGLVILVLIVVLASLVRYRRRHDKAPIEDDSPPGTPELGAR